MSNGIGGDNDVIAARGTDECIGASKDQWEGYRKNRLSGKITVSGRSPFRSLGLPGVCRNYRLKMGSASACTGGIVVFGLSNGVNRCNRFLQSP